MVLPKRWIMKKAKNIVGQNKVLIVLGIILILCLIAIIGVSLFYFYGSSDNVYGNRLDIIEKVPLDDKLLEEIKTSLEKNDLVMKANVSKKGKIVYVNIDYNENTKLEDAKKVAELVVGLFNETELSVYDIQFSIKTTGENGYTLMGARNTSGNGVVWNNRNMNNIKKESAE